MEMSTGVFGDITFCKGLINRMTLESGCINQRGKKKGQKMALMHHSGDKTGVERLKLRDKEKGRKFLGKYLITVQAK